MSKTSDSHSEAETHFYSHCVCTIFSSLAHGGGGGGGERTQGMYTCILCHTNCGFAIITNTSGMHWVVRMPCYCIHSCSTGRVHLSKTRHATPRPYYCVSSRPETVVVHLMQWSRLPNLALFQPSINGGSGETNIEGVTSTVFGSKSSLDQRKWIR